MRVLHRIRKAAAIAGIGLCLYPLLFGIAERKRLSGVLSTYESRAGETGGEKFEQMIREAQAYNERLYQAERSAVSAPTQGGTQAYKDLLNADGTGVMGSIEIPKIGVQLPICHGTGKEALSAGAGHLEGSSLPVGGENTRSILTGHSGMPGAQLFTRLDELKTGDLFYIRIGNRILAYAVRTIQVIRPEEIDLLPIEEGKDLISLVTCTPYGINTHRLVVSGERIPYRKEEYLAIRPKVPSARELCLQLLPCVLAGIAAAGLIKERKERKRAKQKNKNRIVDRVRHAAAVGLHGSRKADKGKHSDHPDGWRGGHVKGERCI